MKKLSIINKRFAELTEQAQDVEKTKRNGVGDFYDSIYVDSEALLGWSVKARSLLSTACGEESVHYKQFLASSKGSAYCTNHDIFKSLRAVFSAAREDCEGGYLTNLRTLIQAEVSNNELDPVS